MITQIKKQITQISPILLVIPFFISILNAQNFASKGQSLTISEPEKSFRVGEKLQYRVEWLGIPVGNIILNVAGIEKIDSNECYHIIARAMPNRFLTKLYDIEYTVHTYIDKNTLYTVRFEKTRRLRDKIAHIVIDFDRKKNEARIRREGSADSIHISSLREELGRGMPTTIEILGDTQDLFSSFFQFRLMQIKQDHSYPINIYYDERNWTINMKVERPFIKDMRKKGSFAVFKSLLESDLNSYILGKSKLYVYFTADSRRIPLEFHLGTGLGPVRGIIKNIPD
jgi:hypothetical protein